MFVSVTLLLMEPRSQPRPTDTTARAPQATAVNHGAAAPSRPLLPQPFRTAKQRERGTVRSVPGGPTLCAAIPPRDGGTANRSAPSIPPPRLCRRRVARRRAGGRHVEGEGVAGGTPRGEGASGLHVTLGHLPRGSGLPLEGRSSQARPGRHGDVEAAAVQLGRGAGQACVQFP